MKKVIFIILLILCSANYVSAQGRVSFSGGMGISYLNYSGINDYLSDFWNYDNRKSDMKALADFFLFSGIELNNYLELEFNLNYSITSFTNTVINGRHDLSCQFVSPRIFMNYYFGEQQWKILLGGGLGLNLAYLSEKIPNSSLEQKFDTYGTSIVAKAEGDTYLSDNLFIALILELNYNLFKEIQLNNYSTFQNQNMSLNKLNIDSKGIGVKIGLKYFL